MPPVIYMYYYLGTCACTHIITLEHVHVHTVLDTINLRVTRVNNACTRTIIHVKNACNNCARITNRLMFHNFLYGFLIIKLMCIII